MAKSFISGKHYMDSNKLPEYGSSTDEVRKHHPAPKDLQDRQTDQLTKPRCKGQGACYYIVHNRTHFHAHPGASLRWNSPSGADCTCILTSAQITRVGTTWRCSKVFYRKVWDSGGERRHRATPITSCAQTGSGGVVDGIAVKDRDL